MTDQNMPSTGLQVRQNPAKNAGKSRTKRYFKDGIEYCYHRPSGKRLPSLPPNDPRFQAALHRAETEWRRTEEMLDQRITPLKPPSIRTGMPVTPDLVVYHPTQARAWCFSSDEGETAYYHFGSIGTDQIANPFAREIREYFAVLHEFELVNLRQSRSAEGHHHYFAIRTDTSLRGMPRNVLTGAVSPQEYSAVRALTERRGDQSVARCLRDALALTEPGAREMRDDMINRGWLTNGRPPEITDVGLSVIA